MSENIQRTPLLSELLPPFLLYARVELQFAEQSLAKYSESLRHVLRMVGDKPVGEYSADDVLRLKSNMIERGNGVARQVSLLSAFKRMFQFAHSRGLLVLAPESISIPRRPRREVLFLCAEEIERFVNAIPITTRRDEVCLLGLRFRALVEVLLGSAMRIGEVLALDRAQVDFETREAKIVGKGNKERIVFFTDRALLWLRRYLESRADGSEALFVCQNGSDRLKRPDIWRFFARVRKLAGLSKPVRPHLLRHTAATQLLFNGCPIGHIKEILGHERLETTCRYYLGLDHRAAKQAHHRYLVYGQAEVAELQSGPMESRTG